MAERAVEAEGIVKRFGETVAAGLTLLDEAIGVTEAEELLRLLADRLDADRAVTALGPRIDQAPMPELLREALAILAR